MRATWSASIVLLVGFGVTLAGCATVYGPSNDSGGYSQMQLGPNLWSVSFNANSYTSDERVADFALLRCAEVTLQNGYRYFVIASQGDATTYAYSRHDHPIDHPGWNNTIVCFKERPAPGDRDVFAAAANGTPDPMTAIILPSITFATNSNGALTTTIHPPPSDTTPTTSNGGPTIAITSSGMSMTVPQTQVSLIGRKVYEATSVAHDLYAKWGIPPAMGETGSANAAP